MLGYNKVSRTSEMSDINLIHDKHITPGSQRNHPYLCQTFYRLACCEESTGYVFPLPILHKDKNKTWWLTYL